MSFSELVELYAQQAREFSDGVARLGRHHEIGPEVIALLDEIGRLRIQCFEAAEKLERYVRESNTLGDAYGAK